MSRYKRSWSLYVVNGGSMEPELRGGDLVLVSKPLTAVPMRGRLVVLRPPRFGETHLKRIVGLPGDSVAFEQGSLLVNGELLPEPYLMGLPPSPGLESRRWAVGNEECFVLGDNRAHSDDSRSYGPIPIDAVLGEVKLRIWPIIRGRNRR